MNKINMWMSRIFLYLSPVTILICLSENWGFLSEMLKTEFLNIVIGSVLSLWVLSGVWFFVLIVMSSQSRELLLARLANVEVRDEREEQIVGQASKKTFLFMLAILLVLFAASTIRYGQGIHNPIDKKSQSLTIGNWGLLDSHTEVISQFDGTRTEKIRVSEALPLSKTGLLLILIIIQLVAYQITSKSSLKENRVLSFAVMGFLILIIGTALTVKPRYISWAEFPDLLTQAEKGDPEIQNKVGEMLLFGQGVQQDVSAAKDWFIKSSANGNAPAANHLGRIYRNGEGVDRNEVEACKWYHLAADRGDTSGAKENVKICDANGL